MPLFINPMLWIAAASLAGPLLYHLLLRNRPKRRILPTLRFLPVSSQQSMAMHRFKNILLLLLRLLVLLLIVAAFTRPYFAKPETPGAAERTNEAAVYAVDASLSMRAGDRWSAARTRVAALARSIAQDSRQALVLFDSVPKIAVAETRDPSVIEAAIRAFEPGYGHTEIAGAVRSAAELASKLNARHRRVYLISDFQHTGFEQISTDIALPPGVELIPVPIAQASPWNAAVSAVAELPDAEPGKRAIRVQAASYGVGSSRGGLAVFLGEERVGAVEVDLHNAQRVVEVFTLALDETNDYALRATLTLKDALEEDNALDFLLEGREPLRLLVSAPAQGVVFSGDDGGADMVNPYLRAAVAAFGADVNADWVDPAQLTSITPRQYPAVLLECPEAAPAAVRDELKTYVERGGMLVLFPAGGDGAYASELCGSQCNGWRRLDRAANEYRLVSAVVSGTSLAAPGGGGDGLLGHPKAFEYLAVRTPEDDTGVRTLISFDDASPFLVERRLGAGSVFLFTVSLSPRGSDLVLRASFSPFLYQLLNQGIERNKAKSAFLVGDAPPAPPAATTAELTGPGGYSAALPDERAPFAAPGVYTLAQGGDVRTLVVRTEPGESDLGLMDARRIDALAQSGQGEAEVDGPDLASLLDEAPAPDAEWRLWWYALFAGLFLMAIETLVACRTSR